MNEPERQMSQVPAEETNRFARQIEAIPEDAVWLNIVVVGVGAIGRQVALLSAACGAKNLVLYDFDHVSLMNVTTQMYPATAIGRPKVDVCRMNIIEMLRPKYHSTSCGCKVIANCEEFNAKFLHQHGKETVVFVCVDTLHARRRIAEACRDTEVPLMIDTRMALETIRIATGTPDTYQRYLSSLVTDEEAVQEQCTVGSLASTAYIAAGLAMHEFTRYMRKMPTNRDYVLDLKLAKRINIGAAS